MNSLPTNSGEVAQLPPDGGETGPTALGDPCERDGKGGQDRMKLDRVLWKPPLISTYLG